MVTASDALRTSDRLDEPDVFQAEFLLSTFFTGDMSTKSLSVTTRVVDCLRLFWFSASATPPMPSRDPDPHLGFDDFDDDDDDDDDDESRVCGTLCYWNGSTVLHVWRS